MTTPPPTPSALARTLDLDPAGAEVVRAASRHVVRFPASGARTFAVPGPARGPAAEARVASVLARAGVPAARCLAGPVDVGGWVVTAWREVEGVDPEAPPAPASTLGALAASLHRATAPLGPAAVGACDPLGAAEAQLAQAAIGPTAAPAAQVATLRAACTRLRPSWRAAVDAAPDAAAVLHGDLHGGNVVEGRDGAVLVDLELAGWGPVAFDAAPTVAFVRWYGRPDADLGAFDAAYGAPLTGAAGRQGLDEVWAVWSAAWGVANGHRSPAAAEEAEVRVATVATGRAPRPWRLR